MKTRVGILLWGFEAVLAFVATLPCVVMLVWLTGHLPAGYPARGGQVAQLVMEAAWVHTGEVGAAAMVSLVMVAVIVVIFAPLLTAMVIGCLEGEGGPRPGPWSAFKAGLKRWPRYLVLQILVLVVMGAGCFVAMWVLGIVTGMMASAAIVLVVMGLRDVFIALMRRSINPIVLVRSFTDLLVDSPVHVLCGYTVQAAVCALLALTAMRLQLVVTGWWLPALLVLAGAQLLVMGRCVVRAHWMDLLVRIDRETASS